MTRCYTSLQLTVTQIRLSRAWASWTPQSGCNRPLQGPRNPHPPPAAPRGPRGAPRLATEAYPLAKGWTLDLVETIRTNTRAAEALTTDKPAWKRNMVRTAILLAQR